MHAGAGHLFLGFGTIHPPPRSRLGTVPVPPPPPPLEGRLRSRVNHYIPPLASLIAHILEPEQQSICQLDGDCRVAEAEVGRRGL